MTSADEILTFRDDAAPPGASPWVDGAAPEHGLTLVEHDPRWAQVFARTAAQIRAALGTAAIGVEHVGSTSVPGLPAKPIVDVDLTVADPDDEDAYVPALVAAGFVLRVREPWWYGHRMFRGPGAPTNVHVFAPDGPETVRHRMFRDWLREHPEDRDLYRDTKLAAAREANAAGEHVMQYNARKAGVIREIYGRAFAAAGLV
ncbi:GrpB family protein [Isoptericola jiangsuensis]|uniref:GrpB family protein n=1 Tax=Isoptericola jiangsuensis TaxID=548579 RepID=UPI003AAE1DFC